MQSISVSFVIAKLADFRSKNAGVSRTCLAIREAPRIYHVYK